MNLFTIGHSNHNLPDFIELLKRFGIRIVVDVRSQPYSQYAIQFNRETLVAGLRDAGLEYVYLGDRLGGRPTGREFYDGDGKVLYGEYRHSAAFQSGIAELRVINPKGSTAILCSEENPATCHRKLLISRYLHDLGDEVLHIRGNGSVQTDREVTQLMGGGNTAQIGLFDIEETLEWKSIQSVLPKKAPKSFSES